MDEHSRTVSACLRCRRQKLRCSGPGRIPCERCEKSNSECTFTPPRPTRSSAPAPTNSQLASRVFRLEQKLDQIGDSNRSDIQDLQRVIAELAAKLESGRQYVPDEVQEHTLSPESFSAGSFHHDQQLRLDIVTKGLVTKDEWRRLHKFFCEHCTSIVAFLDDQIFQDSDALRGLPFMSTVICLISARAIQPTKYQSLIAEADELTKITFDGPVPDLLTLQAMMLFAAWTGRQRLWGYIASIAAELKLDADAIRLKDDFKEQSRESINRARTWFSLVCFDLVLNHSRPFVISDIEEFLVLPRALLTSPHGRPVDVRICAYIEGFSIAAMAKKEMRGHDLESDVLSEGVVDLLSTYDGRVDGWFHGINNGIDPLYQTFANRQDRNRFMVAYCFLKIYVNSFSIHVPKLIGGTIDAKRLPFIQRAVDHAVLLLKTQTLSKSFRQTLPYSLDYNAVTTHYAIMILLKAITAAHNSLNYGSMFVALLQTAQMFEEAGAANIATIIRQQRGKLASITQTQLQPMNVSQMDAGLEEEDDLFDIPGLLNKVT
ncbi:hypothetical protein BX600DRAFT_267017 [Xylariales sp. PMI_506]|nr:hypothetical protein BX600DRAFT_267017 [Xylariales sp. PMI_506]